MNELSQAGGGPAQVDDANKPRPTPLDLEPPHRFETRQETEELVEHVLRAQPGVAEAVVVLARADGGGGDASLVAYVSPASAASGEGEGAAERGGGSTAAVAFGRASSLGGLRSALPAYMVPSVVVGVDAWPRTSSGKIDRKRLPAPSAMSTAEGDAAGVIMPRTREEALVVEEHYPSGRVRR